MFDILSKYHRHRDNDSTPNIVYNVLIIYIIIKWLYIIYIDSSPSIADLLVLVVCCPNAMVEMYMRKVTKWILIYILHSYRTEEMYM